MARAWWSVAGATALASLLCLPNAAGAQGPNDYPAAIYAGGCDDLGEVVAELAPAQAPVGDAAGRGGGVTAAQSRTALPLALDALLAADASLVVADPANPDRALACGALGGVLDANGALVVGATQAEGVVISTIAYLSPSGTGTDVSLFVADPSAPRVTRKAGIAPAPAGPEPEPAPTPVPPDEPAAADDAAVRAYAEAVQPIVEAMTLSLGKFAELTEAPRLEDEDWLIEFATVLAVWQLSYDNIQDATPPPGLEASHGLLVEAFRAYSETADLLAQGLDEGDRSALESAIVRIDEANALFWEANAALEEFVRNR